MTAMTTEMEPRHSSMGVCARAGVTYRQLDYWARTGIVHPINPTPGNGYVIEYDESEVTVIIRLGALVRAGFHLRVAAELARLPVGVHDLGAGLRLEVS